MAVTEMLSLDIHMAHSLVSFNFRTNIPLSRRPTNPPYFKLSSTPPLSTCTLLILCVPTFIALIPSYQMILFIYDYYLLFVPLCPDHIMLKLFLYPLAHHQIMHALDAGDFAVVSIYSI